MNRNQVAIVGLLALSITISACPTPESVCQATSQFAQCVGKLTGDPNPTFDTSECIRKQDKNCNDNDRTVAFAYLSCARDTCTNKKASEDLKQLLDDNCGKVKADYDKGVTAVCLTGAAQ